MRDTHTILTELEKTGELKQIVACGFCPPTIFRDLSIFRFIDARKKTGGKTTESVVEASVAFGMCERSVFKIIKTFSL